MATATLRTPYVRRRRVGAIAFRAATYLALLLVLLPAAWVLLGVVARAVPHWKWSVLWTTSSNSGGGLLNAILGSIVIMIGVLIVAGTIGVLAGIHLSEMATISKRSGKQRGNVMRTATEVLSGVPSIVLGYVGYVALVVGLHWGFSLGAALVILSMMVIPYIAKSTEGALRQVPTNYREGAEALGMSRAYALRKIVLRSGLPGIVTGLIFAVAIAGGETAPLLYTAGWTNQNPSLKLLHQPIAYLTYPVWTYYQQANNGLHYLAYDAALLLIVLILILLVGSRFVVARTQKYSEGKVG
jgi:phosphate transport system permease protein